MTPKTCLLLLTMTLTIVHSNQHSITFPTINETYFRAPIQEPSTPLGLKIANELFDNKSNFLISPFNIFTCLALVHLAANGDTRLELTNLIGDMKKGLFRKDLKDVHSAIRVFLDSSISIKTDYAVAVNYSINHINFSDTTASRDFINNWVRLETNGTIRELLSSHLDPLTRAVLISAIHFKSDWLHPFEPIKPKNFELNENQSIEIPYMGVFANFPVYRGKTFDGLGIPYKSNGLTFYILLPHMKGERAVKNLLKFITPLSLNEMIYNMRNEDTIIMVPKFQISQSLSLSGVLRKFGVNKMFDPVWADFSNLCEGQCDPKIYVSDILHSTFLQINELGTEAGAATAVIVTKSGHPVFRVTRPFVFVLADPDGLILFLGAFTNPSG